MSYMKLWHLLLDRGINKAALMRMAGISTTSLSKLTRGDNIYTNILVKVCTALNYQPGDIMELIADKPTNMEVKS
jgi:DNA-binding Xre family transcriptional regulator